MQKTDMAFGYDYNALVIDMQGEYHLMVIME